MDENISRAAGASHGQGMERGRLPGARRAARPHARAAHHALRPRRRRPIGRRRLTAVRRSTGRMPAARYRTGHDDLDDRDRRPGRGGRRRPTTTTSSSRCSSRRVRMGRDGADRGDLKLVNAALKEMRYAFLVFAPYRDVPKVSIFGSARTQPRRPALRAGPRLRAAHGRRRTGWSSPAPGPGSWRPASRAPAPTTPSA